MSVATARTRSTVHRRARARARRLGTLGLAGILLCTWAGTLAGCGGEELASAGCVGDADCGAGGRCAAGVCTEVRCGCTAVWAPVCGTDGLTYANACEASCAAVGVASTAACATDCASDDDCRADQRCTASAECLPDPGCEGQGCPSVCSGHCVDADCGCSPTAEPVCGVDGTTYPNECIAKCRGVERAVAGACAFCPELACAGACPGGAVTDVDGCPTCGCAPILCDAVSPCPEGMRCDAQSCVPSCPECDDCQSVCVPVPTCGCPPGGEPVCGVDGHSYESACAAACAGVTTAHPGVCWAWCEASGGACEVACPWGFQLDVDQGCLLCACHEEARALCRDSRDCAAGQWCNPAACAPSCAGCLDCQAACEPLACDCPSVWEPVCDDLGWTFANGCEASCAGVEAGRLGACGASCQCPSTWSPVCGVDGATYANACHAECAAVAVAAHGRCDCVGSCSAPSPVCGADRRTYLCGVDEAGCNGVDVLWAGTCDAPQLCAATDCGPGLVCDAEACAPECPGCSGCAPACRPG